MSASGPSVARPEGAGSRTSFRVLLALFLLSIALVNPYIRGDGNGYYAYVRSVVIDQDLNFADEFAHGDPLFHDRYFDDSGNVRSSMLTSTGRVTNQWAVGPSLLWLPFFLTAHGAVLAANLAGLEVPPDGYSAPYRWSCAFGTALYGWLAILMGWSMAGRTTGRTAALVAALGLWWASSLPVYMYFLPFHVHALAAFSVTLFVWCWFRWQPFADRGGRWFVWGLTGGLMASVYYLDALFLTLAIWELGLTAQTPAERPHRRWRPAVWFACGAWLALLPHFWVKWALYGSPFVTGYQDEFFWSHPRFWQVGFSPDHGLFTWTPVVLLAAVGLLVWAWRHRFVGSAIVTTLALFYYVVASYQTWHGLSSFGNRFFLSFTFAWVVGLATFIQWSGRRAWRHPALARASGQVIGVGLVLWNIGLIFQWGTDIIPNRGSVSFGTVARNQITVVPSRIGGFLWRYFTDRSGLTEDVEQTDRLEPPAPPVR